MVNDFQLEIVCPIDYSKRQDGLNQSLFFWHVMQCKFSSRMSAIAIWNGGKVRKYTNDICAHVRSTYIPRARKKRFPSVFLSWSKANNGDLYMSGRKTNARRSNRECAKIEDRARAGAQKMHAISYSGESSRRIPEEDNFLSHFPRRLKTAVLSTRDERTDTPMPIPFGVSVRIRAERRKRERFKMLRRSGGDS